MNNIYTEEAVVFHKMLDENIEKYIREAEVLIRESDEEAANTDECLLDQHSRGLQQKRDRFEALSSGKGDTEEYNLFYDVFLNARIEGFIKGYLTARLGIQAGHNPYNWRYLGNRFVEIMGTQETNKQEEDQS